MSVTAPHIVDQALSLLKHGDAQKALEILTALESSGGSARDLYHVLALASLSLNRAEAALSYLRKELSLFPDNVSSAQLLQELEQEMNPARQPEPDQNGMTVQLLEDACRLIQQAFQQEQWEQCLQISAKLLETVPQGSLQNIHIIRAECFERSKQYFSALGELSQELSLMDSKDSRYSDLQRRVKTTADSLRFRKPLLVPVNRFHP